MRYPVVSLQEATTYVHGRKAGRLGAGHLPRVDFRECAGGADELIEELEDTLESAHQLFLAQKGAHSLVERDGLEGELVALVHPALLPLPGHILCDRDFWRWLTIRWLFDFATWRDVQYGRESSFPADESYGCSGMSLSPDTVGLRMFNRGEISILASQKDEDPYLVARVNAGDLWKSHILRTVNAYSPLLVRELALRSARHELPPALLRETVKRIRRLRSNIAIESLDQDGVSCLVQQEITASAAELKAVRGTQ
jgi:hypothetical protein